jgi:putative ABC transport system permease protein
VAGEVVHGFSAFLGSPYVFADYFDGHAYLGWPQQSTTFIALNLTPGADAERVRQQLVERLPDVDIRTARAFARQSATYWLIQTGAGGALLTAAALGFLFGLVVVGQNMYAITIERIGEFATLRAIGASRHHLVCIVLIQALSLGTVGVALGLSFFVPGVIVASSLIPWVYAPFSLLLTVTLVGMVMCVLASVMAIQPVLRIDPAIVFRT